MGLDHNSSRDRVWTHEVVKEEPVRVKGEIYCMFLLVLLVTTLVRPGEAEELKVAIFVILTLAFIGPAFNVRDAWKSKGRVWKKRVRTNTYTYTIRLTGVDLVCETRLNGRQPLFSTIRIPLSRVWGIKNTGYELLVMRKRDKEIAFSICTTQFADLDAKADFMKTMEGLGKKVLGRASDPSDYVSENDQGMVTR